MNKVILTGRLTQDPETRTTSGNDGVTTVRFSLAVNRRFKNKEGNYEADFPRCVAWGKTAEFISQYFSKGMAIGVTGRLQTGSYMNKDGMKVYTTDVVVEEAEFIESKKMAEEVAKKAASSGNNDFMDIPDDIDDDLPFN